MKPVSRLTQCARSVYFGFTLPKAAFQLILRHPTLLLWSILPIALALGVSWYIFGSLQEVTLQWSQSWLRQWGLGPGWIDFFLLVIKVGIFFLAAASFSIIAGLVSTPFNDFLAENTEKWVTPPLSPVSAENQTWAAKLRFIFIDLGKSLFAVAAMVLVVILSWIPGVQILTLPLTFFLITFQYISYPQTRRGVGLRQAMLFMKQHPFACAGFGAVHLLLFSIPIVAAFVLPVAVVGGTLLVAQCDRGNPEQR